MTALTLAETLFVELIDGNPAVSDKHAEVMAKKAVRYAEIFSAVDVKAGMDMMAKAIEPKLKGCRACHGSGGKASDPCRACKGTGKVAAQ